MSVNETTPNQTHNAYKVKNNRSKYGLLPGALGHTKMQAVKNPRNDKCSMLGNENGLFPYKILFTKYFFDTV